MTNSSKTLTPECVTAVVDTREQQPLDLSPLRVAQSTLTTGDYSVEGLRDVVCVERKGLGDLVQCVGRNRSRFDRVIHRLMAFPARLLIVEATWVEVDDQRWRGNVTSTQVVGSVLSWMSRGIPVVMAGTRQRAGLLVSRFLFQVARKHWQQARSFVERHLNDDQPAS